MAWFKQRPKKVDEIRTSCPLYTETYLHYLKLVKQAQEKAEQGYQTVDQLYNKLFGPLSTK